MSQRPSDRLSIDRIARLWTAESDKVGFGAEDIAEDLIDAALRGEFQYSPKGDWRSPIPDEPLEKLLPITECQTSERSTWSSTIFPPTGAPANYAPRLAMLIETFDRDGNAINSSQLQTYVDARKTAPGAKDRETRRTVASEIFLCVEGLRRWCDEPGFAEWANIRGLSRPRFIDRASGDGAGQASAVVEEPEEADDPLPSEQRKKPAKPMHDRWVERAKELKGLNPGILTSAIASKLRNEDLRFNELNMKSKGSDKMRVIRDASTIRRVLHHRQSEWDIPQES